MLLAVFNKPWKQYPMKELLYGHLPPILQTIQVNDQHLQNTSGEITMNSWAIFSNELWHME